MKLLGTSQLAQRWGVSRQAVEYLLRRDDRMPQGQLLGVTPHSVRAWTLDEIEAYEQLSGRKPVTR